MIILLNPFASDEENVAKTQATQSERKCDGQPDQDIHGSSFAPCDKAAKKQTMFRGRGCDAAILQCDLQSGCK
jgi:hypothetical protein